ncbi:MAG TPA: hypothetical protein VGN95_16060 [Pyrinomonadaceae bacterium]|nr:hypothetical protein [Pyrinomonadaceae bacterium]
MTKSSPKEAIAEIRRALEIDPLSLILNRQYGASLLFARRYDAAIAQMKRRSNWMLISRWAIAPSA